MSSFQSFVNMAQQVLSGHSEAHSVYTANIANANTPGYRTQIPSFEVSLDKANVMAEGAGILSGINQGDSWKLKSQVKESTEVVGQNGNNVKLDHEMVMLADSGMAYMSALRLLSKEMALTRYAISQQ